MNKMLVVMLGSIVALGAMVWMLQSGSQRGNPTNTAGGEPTEPLMFFCAASNRAVMEKIVADYTEEYGREIELQYGGSQTLLSQLEVTGTGDLYLPADDSYLKIAKDKNLVSEMLPIAKMEVVVAVQKGNPKSIQTFDDLLRDDVKLVQANPDATAVGKVTRRMLTESGQWDALDKGTTAYRTTVTEAANDLLVGAADAAIVYDAVLHTYPDLEFVTLSEFAAGTSLVALGVTQQTRQPSAALHFARYVTARDRGLANYAEHGFQVEKGDVWSETPELNLFAGSMLRPAIEDTVKQFEKREGVRVNTVYNGCGILVAQMKAGQVPDAYFACDTEFMEQVPDLFPEPTDVSQNELVIIVKKGNPRQIASLRDLTKEGLRVGIGHEKQCAMGWVTQNTFREGGVQQEVMENVTVQTPTGDMLVNQMRAGSLDAAVVYLSNTAGSGEFLDAVRIQGLDCSVATQPYAITPESPNALTASRLFQQICSTDSQDSFTAEGFRWKLDTESSTDNE
ncbi:extracellular solute-binding protein [Rubripirellula sp.]|nr:extracellular solute-binding protein [Rubripirellula sp.]MDB4645141.1 extracellular solute-binding protein [Rubripirellula sp.]